MVIEILQDGEVIREITATEGKESDLLKRAKLDAEIMNRDLDGVFLAQYQTDEEEETEETTDEESDETEEEAADEATE